MRTLTRPPPSLGLPGARPRYSFLGWLARATLRHRRWVIAAWAAAFIVGAFAASHVSSRLTVDFSLPGQPGYVTAEKILATYHNGGDNTPSILVVSAPPGRSIVPQESTVAAAFGQLRDDMPQLRVVDYGATGNRAFITGNGRATFALVFEPPLTSFGVDTVANQAQGLVSRALPHDQVGLTGLGQLEAGNSSSGPGVFTETLIGAAGALVVLAFVFASFLALLPLVVAAVSILTTQLVVLGLTYLTEVSFIVEFLVALVGLGIAIDYSLLLVTRWREERARGADNHDAVVRAVETAGRSVASSSGVHGGHRPDGPHRRCYPSPACAPPASGGCSSRSSPSSWSLPSCLRSSAVSGLGPTGPGCVKRPTPAGPGAPGRPRSPSTASWPPRWPWACSS